MAQTWPQHSSQDGSTWGHIGRNIGQHRANIGPTWTQDGPNLAQYGLHVHIQYTYIIHACVHTCMCVHIHMLNTCCGWNFQFLGGANRNNRCVHCRTPRVSDFFGGYFSAAGEKKCICKIWWCVFNQGLLRFMLRIICSYFLNIFWVWCNKCCIDKYLYIYIVRLHH